MAVGMVVAVAVGGCAGGHDEHGPPLGPEARDWDVVVILLDALPAAALGCYGYELDVSPNIDAFAAGALRCEQAFAPASYTLASVSTLFTGFPPAAHGVVGLNSNVLRDSLETLAEAMARTGRATAGFSCNPHINQLAGFQQGFGTFEHYVREQFDAHTVPAALEADVLAWWRAHATEPRFLYVHLLPPHQPYDPPAPHAGRFGADATTREEGFTDYLVELDKTLAVTPEQVRRIRARFDSGLHYADAVTGELLRALGEDGGLSRAVVALVSDHGEGFAEHGRLLHGSTVFTEMTRVPLLLRWPGSAPGVHRPLVRTRDLAATLCEIVDAPWLAGPAGESMLPDLLASSAAPGPARSAVSRSTGDAPAWALREGSWTLVEHRASGSRLLYDRASDPRELRDLSAAEPERLEAMTATLRARLKVDRAAAPSGPRRKVDTFWKQLEDLGYVGSDEAGDGEAADEAARTDQ